MSFTLPKMFDENWWKKSNPNQDFYIENTILKLIENKSDLVHFRRINVEWYSLQSKIIRFHKLYLNRF